MRFRIYIYRRDQLDVILEPAGCGLTVVAVLNVSHEVEFSCHGGFDTDLAVDDVVAKPVHFGQDFDGLPDFGVVVQLAFEPLGQTQAHIAMSGAITVPLINVARADFGSQHRIGGLDEVITAARPDRDPVLDVRDAIVQAFDAEVGENAVAKEPIVLPESTQLFGVFHIVVLAINAVGAEAQFVLVPFFAAARLAVKSKVLLLPRVRVRPAAALASHGGDFDGALVTAGVWARVSPAVRQRADVRVGMVGGFTAAVRL